MRSSEVEAVLQARVRVLLRWQKLAAFDGGAGYVVAVDGEGLWERTTAFATQVQHRGVGDKARYAVCVVQAELVCPEGVTLPLGAEFCENVVVGEDGTIGEDVKQDCELQACRRLRARLKAAFPRRPLLVVADRRTRFHGTDRRSRAGTT